MSYIPPALLGHFPDVSNKKNVITHVVRVKYAAKIQQKNNICKKYVIFFQIIFVFFRFSCIFAPNISKNYCTLLYDSRCDVFGFGEIEFLTDLGLALVDGLETLTSEHVDLLGGEIRFEQTA